MANTLVHQLANLLMQSSPLTVEIVPGGIEQWLDLDVAEPVGPAPSRAFPFLHVDGHLGVPTKNLYQLNISAVGLLNTEPKNAISQIDASCVILLANPAHQTAWNIRKRLVETGDLSAHAELEFSARLLPSSRQASKEPVLWAHRRFCFSFLYPRASPADCGTPLRGWERDDFFEVPEIPSDAVTKELQLISRCCEFYPRNYHAWSHHHFVVHCIFVSLRDSHPADTPYLPLLVGELQNLRRYIESHVSDYSAMHEFCSIVARWQPLELPQYNSALGELADPSVHYEHALSLVTAFPSHESLWMYLRAIISISPANSSSLVDSAISGTAPFDGPLRDQLILWGKRRNRFDV